MHTKRTIVNTGLSVGAVAVAVSGWSIASHSSTVSASTTSVVTAKQGNVLSSVTGTGNVIAPKQLVVSFDSAVSSDKITEVDVKQGDVVTVGQVLAKVDNTMPTQALAAAQAQLASAQAALAKAQNPATADVIAQDKQSAAQAQSAVQAAQAAVTTAQNNLTTDTTVQGQAITQAQQSLTDTTAKAQLDLANGQANLDQAQSQLNADAALLSALPSGATAQEVTAAQGAVAKDTTALASAKSSLASLTLSTKQSSEQANNAITNAQNSRTSKLAADRSAIDNADRQLVIAQGALQVTLTTNATKEKAPTAADLAGPQASLINAQNSLATAQRNESATTLVAPMTGTIAATTAQVGVAGSGSGGSSSSSSGSSSSGSSTSGSASAGLFTLSDLTALQVKVGFSESDAANVKVGQATTITFDALTGVSMTGKVTQVDLSGTTVSNVVTYYAYVTIDPGPNISRIKPGMTATVQVVVDHADNVIILPVSAVSARGTSGSVNVEIGSDTSKTTPTPITIGLRGDSGVEIKSGLKAGDNIVIVRQAASGTGAVATGARAGAGAGGFGGAGGGRVGG